MTSDASIRKHVQPLEANVPPVVKQAVVIFAVTDSNGTSIPNGGSTSDGGLRFIGYAPANQQVVIRDSYLRVIEVLSDANGAWSARAEDQISGVHEYRAVVDSVVSQPWAVHVQSGSAVRIDLVKDVYGNPVPPGSVTHETVLFLEGRVSKPGSEMEILDNFTSLGWVEPQTDGKFVFQPQSLLPGYHVFRAISGENNVSEPWEIEVAERRNTVISRVSENDQNGADVPDGGTTFATTLNFVGSSAPGQTVNLYLGSDVVSRSEVDPNAHWSAVVNDLKPGEHMFFAQTDNEPGATWFVTVLELIDPLR